MLKSRLDHGEATTLHLTNGGPIVPGLQIGTWFTTHTDNALTNPALGDQTDIVFPEAPNAGNWRHFNSCDSKGRTIIEPCSQYGFELCSDQAHAFVAGLPDGTYLGYGRMHFMQQQDISVRSIGATNRCRFNYFQTIQLRVQDCKLVHDSIKTPAWCPDLVAIRIAFTAAAAGLPDISFGKLN